MTKLDKLLERPAACPEAREWAKGKVLEEAWNTCPRSGWMGWLAHRLGVNVTASALAKYERVTASAGAKYERVAVAAYRVAVPYSVIAEALRSPAKYPLEREDAST